ncbi:hypothetical protein U27_02079 [Candidatus Vecturithrix granuli]|uniref:Lcl C-terminal domain-containing protein n=1 Tax=Vecturithrix granuli TaxID=1499967 RepID=A0A0S6W9T7_VECG1|nr:hypothetical protein U27_02079 [Candidatus Vecturithrix granuli]
MKHTFCKEQHAKWLKCGVIAALLLFAVAAGVAAYLAMQSRNEALRLYHVSIVQSLVTDADQHFYKGEREQAALLARQAYFLNDAYQANIGDQIRDVLQRTLVIPEGETEELLDRVCQQATRNLTRVEWQTVVQNEQIAYQPCLGLKAQDEAGFVYRLRNKPLPNEEERQHLSLYVKADNYVGTFIDNRFKPQQEGQVIFDHATGLTWQQSGSPEPLTYDQAREYVEGLNLAGYTDWRLPTVEELCSLVKKEQNSNDLFIDRRFDQTQTWVWSADI